MDSPKRILLIEDDADLRNNFAEILVLSNYQVSTAMDGNQGVETALKEKPDLIICDIVIPGLDGYGVFNVLSRHPVTQSVPFIFLSGQRQEHSDLRKGMNMGADDYLLKPLQEIDLLRAVEIRLKKSDDCKSNQKSPFINTDKEKSFDLSDVVAGIGDSRKYKRKHLLYSFEEKITHVYYVNKGSLKGFLINHDGKELITNLYSEGDFLGLTSIFGDSNYCENVQVLEDTEVVPIPKADFITFLDQDPFATASFLKKLAKKIKEKEERMLNLAYNSVRKKVATGIISVIERFNTEDGGQPVIKISRDDLAKIIGTATESMIRTLREFELEKSIEIIEGVIYVTNEKKLRSLQY